MRYAQTLTARSIKPILATNALTSDEALVEAIAEGDRRAMQVLFGRHQMKVYRFLVRMTGNAAAADDLVSEVFFEVWRKAARFEGRSQVSTWLLGIARFKALSAARRRVEDQLDEFSAEMIEDEADNAETALSKQDTGEVIRECLQKLSVEHREIIDLVYYHEKSVDEVATLVGIPAGTVKTRMFYARKRLADLLKDAGIDQSGWC
ncbi:MAG: sigma-70 family RNA polymerase sigma factor [Pseudorhodoplanes sp.]